VLSFDEIFCTSYVGESFGLFCSVHQLYGTTISHAESDW